MYTKFIANNHIPTHTCDEILREMPKFKNDLNAMCKEYGYCEVVNAIYHARNNQFACIDWNEIEDLLDDHLWYDLIPEIVIPYAETDLLEPTFEDLSNAAKETTIDPNYHSPDGNVAIDMSFSKEYDPEEVLREMAKCGADLEKLSEVYDSEEIVAAIYFARKVFPRVNWVHIAELLDRYLWDKLILDCVIVPAQKALQTRNGVYCFNLGIADEEVVQIRNGFYAHSEDVVVFKEHNAIYAKFYADSENEIDRNIEEACMLILHQYPRLSLAGGAFVEFPDEVETANA